MPRLRGIFREETTMLPIGKDSNKPGCLQYYINKWESLTNDPAILDAVKHYHIEFNAGYPVQTSL